MPKQSGEKLGIRFAKEPASDQLFDEIAPLVLAHWREVGQFADLVLDPDWEKYSQADQAGILRVFTARDGENLVGYAVFYVTPNVHYKGSIWASADLIYLAPSYRAQGLGSDLVAFCDSSLQAEGVAVVSHHVTPKFNYSKTLEKMGYRAGDQTFVRRLA